MYARPCECQHKIEEDYLFAFTSRLRQAHGKQVFVCTVQLVQKQAQFAQKQAQFVQKATLFVQKGAFDIKYAVSLSYVSHRAVTHSDSTEMGQQNGNQTGILRKEQSSSLT